MRLPWPAQSDGGPSVFVGVAAGDYNLTALEFPQYGHEMLVPNVAPDRPLPRTRVHDLQAVRIGTIDAPKSRLLDNALESECECCIHGLRKKLADDSSWQCEFRV